jgi:hypothetical protein
MVHILNTIVFYSRHSCTDTLYHVNSHLELIDNGLLPILTYRKIRMRTKVWYALINIKNIVA